ncbi:hypothetical protein GCM10007901_44770 [Dyella acidisoli]|uniref:Uncharacterized protein n=1 Tax=Dyella acidisoli TaxID=1867834 RepID=A0ABQ5XVL5_9GAMM|nr:hypothetical protein GCM10007901_44770 [Dyella acidisoli]
MWCGRRWITSEYVGWSEKLNNHAASSQSRDEGHRWGASFPRKRESIFKDASEQDGFPLGRE